MLTKQIIYDKIAEVLRDELFYDGKFEADTKIISLGLDSIQLMQLFVYLEESFEFEFLEDSVIENMRGVSLGEFADYVCQAAGRSA